MPHEATGDSGCLSIRDRPVQRAVRSGARSLDAEVAEHMADAVRRVHQAPGADRERPREPRVGAHRRSPVCRLLAWNVSPPVTEHVTWLSCETSVAAKVALAACTDVGLRAAATPAAESAAAMIRPSSASRFLDMVPSWSR